MVRLQRIFPRKGHDKPEFVSCQHHIFDRFFRFVMDEEVASNSLNIECFLVKELKINYEELRGSFQNGTRVIEVQAGKSDDKKLLFHLPRTFRFFHEKRNLLFMKLPDEIRKES